MFRQAVVGPVGIALGVGTALTAFGLAAPASASTDCTGGVTVDAVEADIRAAIDNGETLICINPGTIDMSSTGVDGSAEAFSILDVDLTVIALGEVVLDGGGDSPSAFVARRGSVSESLTVDGFTFTGFTPNDSWPGVVVLEDSAGTLTVSNSIFTSNSGKSMVNAGNFGNTANLVVENSVFDNNVSTLALVNVQGYAGGFSVSDSSFVDNQGRSIRLVDDTSEGSEAVLTGNYFGGNAFDGAAVYVSATSSDVHNNTFVGNVATYADTATALSLEGIQESRVLFNTFVDNSSTGGSAPNVFIADAVLGASFLGNIWATGESGTAIGAGAVGDVDDLGGNFSTSADSQFLDSSSSQVNVARDSLDLSEPTDNGGATNTVALGAASIAIDALNPADFGGELEIVIPTDQRGESRIGLWDAGAFEYSGAESDKVLADTGAKSGVIGLVGGGLLAAGATVAVMSAVRHRLADD